MDNFKKIAKIVNNTGFFLLFNILVYSYLIILTL